MMEHNHLLDIDSQDLFALKTLQRALDMDIEILWFNSHVAPSLDIFYYGMDFIKDGRELVLRERREDLETRTLDTLRDAISSECDLFEEVSRIGDIEIQKQHILNVFKDKYGNEWTKAGNILGNRRDRMFESCIGGMFSDKQGFEDIYSYALKDFAALLEAKCEQKMGQDFERKMCKGSNG